MATEVFMPSLGESVFEGTISTWLKKEGDKVERYEPILEIETDKVTTEATAEVAGTLLMIVAKEGETVVVRALAEDEAKRAGVSGVWWTLAGLAAVLVVLAVIVADRLGRTLVRPVDELARTADQMASGDLEARVEVAGPAEIQRVGRAFNRLATQIGALLQLERETAADLSHRLRTPLTGARLNADALPEF